MNKPSTKYYYQVPGLDGCGFEWKKDVWKKIEEIANKEREVINANHIVETYKSHKDASAYDSYFTSSLKKLNKFFSSRPESNVFKRQRGLVVNHAIIRGYYSYLNIEFQQFQLSLEEISVKRSRHNLLECICREVLTNYDYENFKNVVIPSDILREEKRQEIIALQMELRSLKDQPTSSIRKQHNLNKKIEKAKKIHDNPLYHVTLKPIHYVKMALRGDIKLSESSFHALKAIITHYLQTQDQNKVTHNKLYKKETARSGERKRIRSFKKIGDWMINNPENNCRRECARDLGISPSTVSRNWAKAKEFAVASPEKRMT